MRSFAIFSTALVAVAFASRVPVAFGQAAVITGTFTNNTAGTIPWNVGTNWDTNPQWPSGEGAVANFNGTVDGSTNPARSISMSSAVVVSGISINLDTNNETTPATLNRDTRFINGTGGSLAFNGVGSGPATLDVGGTGNTRLSFEGGGASAFALQSDIVVTVSNTTYTGTTGALNVQSPITGAFGVTKEGAGTMTLSSNAKTYSGATILNAGRTRLSAAAGPTNTASFTINNGAHLEPITDGDYTLGPGTLFLNGTGIANAGAIRPNRETTVGRKITITNPVQLLSTSSLHSQTQTGSTSFGDGRITLTGLVSGPGMLQLTAPLHDQHLGTYHLTADNTYSGGTELHGGRLIVGDLASGFPNASLGTGDVTVFNSALVNGAARSLLTIPTGALNAIADTATLTLGGGFNLSAQQSGHAELGAGVNEFVGSLVLGATTYNTPGQTFGRVGSGAAIESDEFFVGDGIITIAAATGTPGDYNDDGTVDAADYVIFRKSVGQASTLPNDPNGGTVDDDQYDTWVENFGEPAPGGGGSGAVPEPCSALLMLTALAGLTASRRSVR